MKDCKERHQISEGLLREFATLKCTRDHIMQQFRPEIKVPAEVARKQFERYGHEFGRAEELYQRYMHDEVVRGERDDMANSFSGEKVMFLQTETSTLTYRKFREEELQETLPSRML